MQDKHTNTGGGGGDSQLSKWSLGIQYLNKNNTTNNTAKKGVGFTHVEHLVLQQITTTQQKKKSYLSTQTQNYFLHCF